MPISVGVDLHKTFFVFSQDGARPPRSPATAPGSAQRVTHLGQPERIVREPSGGDERSLLAALHAAGLTVARVPPRQVRAVVLAQGITAKSDPRDARVLARFGTVLTRRLTPARDPAQAEVQALTTRRQQVQVMRGAEQHRRDQQTGSVRASIERVLALLETDLADVATQIEVLVTTTPGWPRPRAVLCPVPGIGGTAAHLVLAELPARGTLAPRRLRPWSGSPRSCSSVGRAAARPGLRAGGRGCAPACGCRR